MIQLLCTYTVKSTQMYTFLVNLGLFIVLTGVKVKLLKQLSFIVNSILRQTVIFTSYQGNNTGFLPHKQKYLKILFMQKKHSDCSTNIGKRWK